MSETNHTAQSPPNHSPFRFDTLFYLLCLLLIASGLVLRFSWLGWNEGANLHPDEYGLTNTLTQLSMPASPAEYFNTRISPISPYHKYDAAGQQSASGPDNRMRWGQWPIILIRWTGELSGSTGYDEIRLWGRHLSALADTLSILLVFLIGRRLYGARVGALGAALSALAVMQIQQSHFMTVDNFAALFTIAAIYASVRIAQTPCVRRPESETQAAAPLKIDPDIWKWVALFGVSYGMAVASKINLVPLAAMIVVALFISIADIRLKTRRDLGRILAAALLLAVVSGLVSVVTFRVTQPMTFRAQSGDTTFFTLSLNPDWLDSMEVAQSESKGIGGGPPSEQWAHRTRVLFPLMNMVLWGMGLPLGAAAWAGYLAAAWQMFKDRKGWRSHLIPFLWTGGYFLFMSTRWVSSVRYFLPIYPLLCLFAAWGLVRFWESAERKGSASTWVRRLPAAAALLLVIGSAWLWAFTFTRSVYGDGHTRIHASRWIVDNIPAAVNLSLQADGGGQNIPIPAPDNLMIGRDQPFKTAFTAPASGFLSEAFLPKAVASAPLGQLKITLAAEAGGGEIIAESALAVSDQRAEAAVGRLGAPGSGEPVWIQEGQRYSLAIENLGEQQIVISKVLLANESWDEGLPVRIDGWDPFGQLYNGVNMEVRWYDDENKRQMFIEWLSQVDYIILPSQRGIWSTCRIPRTYPMTIEYYRALFGGELGFDLVAEFSAPLQIGPLYISDVGGVFRLNEPPGLPLCNFNPLAAEEAFSVYDHPPVWIFKKRADFDLERASAVLNAVDLSQVVIESPRDATAPWELNR